MTINRTIATTLVLICIALWVLLLRPLFSTSQAKAQALSSAAATQSPIILQPQVDQPYLVVANGQISVWYVLESDPLQSKPGETVQEMTLAAARATKLVRADIQPLPTR